MQLIRASLRFALALACIACAGPAGEDVAVGDKKAPSPAPRDWKANPAIVEIDTTEAVYALGDVHGDYDRMVNLLVATSILKKEPSKPSKARWAAGKAVLVCTGDLIDKWNQSVQVIDAIRALQADAARAGGRVVVLMGNHEAEFLADAGAGKKFADFVKELKLRKFKPRVVAAGQDEQGVGAFLRNLPLAARVNDWFFAHAGNTQGRTLLQLAVYLRAGIDRQGYRAPALRADDSLLEARLHPAPWWERPKEAKDAGLERLAGYAKALGVKHLAIGHQPSKVRFADGSTRKAGEMYAYGDGLLFLIDVGMSRGVGDSRGALLRIRGEQATALFPDGTKKALWAGR
jgi:hypothetical protein